MDTFTISSISTTTNVITTSSTSSSSSASFSISWMDSKIWRKLPQRLLDRIIAFLPPPAFFRARCVCKRWYGLLFSTTFLEIYLQISPRRPWFLFFKKQKSSTFKSNIYSSTSCHNHIYSHEAYLFDPHEVTWYRLPFESVPAGFSPAAASGGLICLVNEDAGPKTLILYNPVLRSITQLPPTQRPRLFPSIGITVSHALINVVVAGDDLISPFAVKNLSSESFHVDGAGFFSLWGTTCPLPRLCSLESGGMVFVNGRFYCMNYSPFSVLAYDVAGNEWWKIQAPMKRFLRSPSLVECKGRVVLVAAVEKSKLNVPRSLRLWSLQGCGRNWVEFERMPQQLYGRFMEIEGGRGFDCAGHGNFVVFTIHGSDQVLLYDFYTKAWQWIPQCPFVEGGGGGSSGGGGGLQCFAYEPLLATPAIGLLEQPSMPF
ncbi:protein UNUSUAL FLORAL ORGANS [Telopea speciosissima]|uniref:protein UNUSUAL FLORAL ORGANS n=1 Tax=Telopea speciosissima TaxID=54955 RepID=UPI001CC81000|nr:protein UNUSUAL FLORAL ORGANS [Telopea speciosissima]